MPKGQRVEQYSLPKNTVSTTKAKSKTRAKIEKSKTVRCKRALNSMSKNLKGYNPQTARTEAIKTIDAMINLILYRFFMVYAFAFLYSSAIFAKSSGICKL